MLTLSEQITHAREAFAEAPDERAHMGRISGVLWMCAATVGIADAFLPGSEHASTPLVLAVGVLIFLYGLASVTGWIPWEKASMNALAMGMAATIPVTKFTIYLTNDSISFVKPLLICSLLYTTF